MDEQAKREWYQRQQDQALAVKQYWARVRDIDAREQWMHEQHLASGTSQQFAQWMSANTPQLEAQWLEYCEPVQVETLPSDETCCGYTPD